LPEESAVTLAFDVPVSAIVLPLPLVLGEIDPEIEKVGIVWPVKLTAVTLAPLIVGD
jgi:hypothetical protein